MTPKFIRVSSDLHLEQYLSRNIDSLVIDLLPSDDRDAESVLVLAGDISSSPWQLTQFIHTIEHRFFKVIYIPGNHELYKHELRAWLPHTTDLLESETKNTIFSLDGVSCTVLDGVRYIFGTMWADGGDDLMAEMMVENGLNDFRLISIDGRRFKVKDMQKMHADSVVELTEFLNEKFNGTTVVISHHLPAYSLCHPRFGTSINGGFAANLDYLMYGDTAPDLWIHGHSHDRGCRTIGKTKIVCNPSGYRGEYGNGYSSTGPVFIELQSLKVTGI
jgi:calcineurin-like phosphoesterase family protein